LKGNKQANEQFPTMSIMINTQLQVILQI